MAAPLKLALWTCGDHDHVHLGVINSDGETVNEITISVANIDSVVAALLHAKRDLNAAAAKAAVLDPMGECKGSA